MIERPTTNGRLTIAIIIACLSGLILVAGWVLVISNRMGKMEGNRFTAKDGFRVETRIEECIAETEKLEFRIKRVEERESPPREVAMQLKQLNAGMITVNEKLAVITRSLIVLKGEYRRLGVIQTPVLP